MLTPAELDLLLESNHIITSTLDLDVLLVKVMELAKRVIKADAASLLLLDEFTNELVFDVALGEKTDKIKTIRLKMGEGIAGWVAQQGKPLLIEDVTRDTRWYAGADQVSKFHTRSILCVPLKYQDKIIGVIEALNRTDISPDQPDYFTESDIPLFETFANQAAIAIVNARLFRNLQEEKEKIDTIFTEMSDAAIITDAHGKIIITNPAVEKFFGHLHQPGDNLFISWREAGFNPDLADLAVIAGTNFHFEGKREKGKTLFVSVAGTKIFIGKESVGRDATVEHLVYVLRDVTTERKEERLKRSFLSLISHKLRTPLTAVLGYAPLLLEKNNLDSFQRKAISTINQQANLLAKIVERLLRFTSLESEILELTITEVSLCELIQESIQKLNLMIKDTAAEITVASSALDSDVVSVDREKMGEVIRNLIENGIKFNKLRTDSIRPEKIRIIIGVNHPTPEQVEVYVTDNGPGIPPEESHRIFQKFYQVEESFTGQIEGPGLGLAYVKRVTEAHQGTVKLTTNLGQGSTFTLTLPNKKNNQGV